MARADAVKPPGESHVHIADEPRVNRAGLREKTHAEIHSERAVSRLAFLSASDRTDRFGTAAVPDRGSDVDPTYSHGSYRRRNVAVAHGRHSARPSKLQQRVVPAYSGRHRQLHQRNLVGNRVPSRWICTSLL